MIDKININICIGILLFGFLLKMINLYINFYKICKNLDTDDRIKFFYNKYIINIILKYNIVKHIFIFYILIPTIKINYFILSFFISLIHSLCEMEYDNFMEKNGFSFSNLTHDEIEKILNNNSDDENNDDENNDYEKYKILENKEKLIDQKIEFYMKNQNNIENFNINNLEDIDKIQNLIISNNLDLDNALNIEELKKDINIINEGIEVLKIDDIDFGDNLNTFFNNFNIKENKIKVDNTENIVIIKAGKKKINK